MSRGLPRNVVARVYSKNGATIPTILMATGPPGRIASVDLVIARRKISKGLL